MLKVAVIGLSGGLDSATLLAHLIEQEKYDQVHCVQFSYGSKHGSYERAAAEKMVKYYRDQKKCIIMHKIDMEAAFGSFKSDLLKSGGAIPEGHYEAESMKATVVPGRNLIFASILAGLAESVGAQVVGLGVHAGDHAIYPDCRPAFIYALEMTVSASSNGTVRVIAPFLNDTKAEIVQRGTDLNVPYLLTRTCYKDQEHACGKCGSCQERKEAFDLNKLRDPIFYEEY